MFTGAGISAPSGLTTFRGNGRLWNDHRIEDICNEHSWKKNFHIVHEFYNKRRQDLENAIPNQAHRYFSELQNKYSNQVNIITQNVDNLFEKSGANDICHLHGF